MIQSLPVEFWIAVTVSLVTAKIIWLTHRELMIFGAVVERITKHGGYLNVRALFDDKEFYDANITHLSFFGFGFYGVWILWSIACVFGSKIGYQIATMTDIVIFCFGISACIPFYNMTRQYSNSSNFREFIAELIRKTGTKVTVD